MPHDWGHGPNPYQHHPPRKRRSGCMGCLFTLAAAVFILVVIGVVLHVTGTIDMYGLIFGY